MQNKINYKIYMDALNILILSKHENIKWLCENTSCDRSDKWRDKIFDMLQLELTNLIAERELALNILREGEDC